MSWRSLRPSDDGTHHVRDGAPAYDARFDAVLKFHAPGLAPVARGGEAWHVDEHGAPAYARRFRQTFGFYESAAAVESADGWHHIRPDGNDLSARRFAWCGNYQEGRCAVRDRTGRYLHLDASGAPCGARTWRYAGDYRDGVAVVQSDDGRSTHVTADGALLHDRWFEDLDVFHKGLARARDARGWTHVDTRGDAVYARRFAMVEPFYNGQARVERFDGALEVIDPTGATRVELRPARRSELAALSSDLVGYWRTEAIAAAVAAGVFEALPAPSDAIAARCGLAVERAPRLLRALEELHLVEGRGGVWHATARGALLTRAHPCSLATASGEYAGRLGAAWRDLRRALRDGAAWTPPRIFDDVAARDTDGHHAMLRSYARHDYAEVPAALGLRGDESVLDVGGGLGVLAEAVARRYPGARVVLLDRPEVAARVDVAPDLRGRVEVRGGDFFAPWSGSFDAIVLARVLHDWDDPVAAKILSHARAALAPGGRVYVVEMLLPDEGGAGGLCDLHLLVATGGRERTRDGYARLLQQAGLTLREVRALAALPSILVAEAP